MFNTKQSLARQIEDIKRISKEAEDLFQLSGRSLQMLASDKARSTFNVMASGGFSIFQKSFRNLRAADNINASICEVGWKFWAAAKDVHSKSTIDASKKRASQRLLDRLQQGLETLDT